MASPSASTGAPSFARRVSAEEAEDARPKTQWRPDQEAMLYGAELLDLGEVVSFGLETTERGTVVLLFRSLDKNLAVHFEMRADPAGQVRDAFVKAQLDKIPQALRDAQVVKLHDKDRHKPNYAKVPRAMTSAEDDPPPAKGVLSRVLGAARAARTAFRSDK